LKEWNLSRLCAVGLSVIVCGGGVSACKKKKKPEQKLAAVPAQLAAPVDALSKEIEALTGAHARLVWNASMEKHSFDLFSHGTDQVLRGIDTRDGRGERTILAARGNYSRPLLSPDGERIVYSERNLEKTEVGKTFSLMIYRTDWAGNPPVRLASGQAVDVWRDPKTGVDWVYCVRRFRDVHGSSLDAGQLWRFPLLKPKEGELFMDNTRLSQDNIQLSRDGALACGLFPWPQGGVVHLDRDPPEVRMLSTGCWTSCAPDMSGIAWVFDGGHKGATFFAEDGARSWHVDFDAPCAALGQLYHPRWSSHPRFMVLTGPYDGDEKIQPGRHIPEVYLGRMTKDAKKMEAWVQVSRYGKPASYPDAWIEGGEAASLDKPAPAGGTGIVLETKWPVSSEGVLFAWKDKWAQNEWKDREGRSHTVEISGKGAARFGRHGELLLDGGFFEVREDAETKLSVDMKAANKFGFEALLMEGPPDAAGWLVRTPSFGLYQRGQELILVADDGLAFHSTSPDLIKAAHLCVNRSGTEFAVFLNGNPLPLASAEAPPAEVAKAVTFGGGGLARGMERVAFYDHPLDDRLIRAESEAQLKRLSALPAAPPRVRLRGKLVEISRIPSLEAIQPYTGALVSYVYEVEEVREGALTDKRVLVKQWGLLNSAEIAGFPRQIGQIYDLSLERESDHPELRGERLSDDTTAFDLPGWFDVGKPDVRP
jgi:hypothetical protein